MISIFSLWTFHLYLAKFQQHLLMEYISRHWYDIPWLLVPIIIFWRDLLLTRKLLNQWFQVVKSWSHQFQSFTIAIMTWLTVVQYLCHKLPRIYSVCRNHNPVLSLFMTYHRVYNMSNTTCATSGAGTVYPSRASEFTTCLLGVMLFNL